MIKVGMQTGPEPPYSLAQESGHSSLEKLRRLEAVTQSLLLLHLTCYFVTPHSPKEGISGILSVLRRLEEGGDHTLSQDISPWMGIREEGRWGKMDCLADFREAWFLGWTLKGV